MPATIGSFMNTNSGVVNEIISKSLELGLPTLSPFWKRVQQGNPAIVERDKMGRDYTIIKTFRQGMAGVFEDGGPRLDSVLYGDPLNLNLGDKTFLQGQGFGANAQGWPDALDGPNPLPYRMDIHMRSMLANLAWTLAELDMEALPAYVNEIMTPKLLGHATLMSHRLCTQFFLNQNTNYRICKATSVTVSANTLTFKPDNLTINRFAIGHRIQLWKQDAAHTLANLKTVDAVAAATVLDRDSMFMVTKIDDLTNTVTLMPISNVAITTSAGVVGHEIAASPSNSDLEVSFFGTASVTNTPNSGGSTTGIAGIRSWMKVGDGSGSTQTNDNTLLGLEANSTAGRNINVNTHPEFKTMEVDQANQPLTEHTLRKIIRAYHMRRGNLGHRIDTLLASDGVWLGYEATKIGREQLERNGNLSSLNKEGSEEGFTFSFDGRKYKGETDPYMDANTVYGIKTEGGNWKRYTRPSGHGKKWDKSPSGVPYELVASSMTGLPSNQLPILRVASNNASAQLTEYVQMPGRLVMQVVPEQASGLIIKNVAEDRLAYA